MRHSQMIRTALVAAPVVDRFLAANNLVLRARLIDAPARPAQLRDR
jgi:hypothetical protein